MVHNYAGSRVTGRGTCDVHTSACVPSFVRPFFFARGLRACACARGGICVRAWASCTLARTHVCTHVHFACLRTGGAARGTDGGAACGGRTHVHTHVYTHVCARIRARTCVLRVPPVCPRACLHVFTRTSPRMSSCLAFGVRHPLGPTEKKNTQKNAQTLHVYAHIHPCVHAHVCTPVCLHTCPRACRHA